MPKNRSKSGKIMRIRPHNPRFHIEIDGTSLGVDFVIGGVLGISSFSENEIRLILKYGSVTLTGRGLCISLFESNVVSVGGSVENIAIKYIKRGKGYVDKT